MKLYGIKNCDTVRKALKYLDEKSVSYEFVDFKTTPLSAEIVNDWLKQCPDTLVNKRSTTFRKVKTLWLEAEDNLDEQIKIIIENPSLIKRPVLEKESGEILLGFKPEIYNEL